MVHFSVNMHTFTTALMTVFLFFSSLLGQGVSLSGRVVDAADSTTVLAGARVSLQGHDLTTETNHDGEFVLEGSISSLISEGAARYQAGEVSLHEAGVQVRPPRSGKYSLALYDTHGRSVYTASGKSRAAGEVQAHSFSLARGVYTVVLSQGSQRWTSRVSTISAGAVAAEQSGEPATLRSSPPSENILKVEREGYHTEYVSLTSLQKHAVTLYVSSQFHLHQGIMASTFWVGQGAGDDNHHISNVPSAWDTEWGDNFGLEDAPQIPRDGDFIPQDARFTGRENPYYIALPYNDYDSVVFDGSNPQHMDAVASLQSEYYHAHNKWLGRQSVFTRAMAPIFDTDEWALRKESAHAIPWKEAENWSGKSMVKGRWVRIRYQGGEWVYAQWLDAGPYHYDDTAYVFGSARPRNEEGSGMDVSPYAGIDISPSVWLKMGVEQDFFDQWGGINDTVDWQFVREEDVPPGPWKHHVSDNKTNWVY
ncbi:carboxypeptidase-like regulatory domain-containing protein [Chitinivibrio alkaliphilus]|uniref:Uncharacterized protein n=1 Tax=Chitinivibrio alkaliphilus ACht1 TaxID=1313304 RepID=U7D748_9BACT|nr:carboxypeptidase-like regulatory domain-containing protein [Chitinivibrio alkaliphilus]ERP38770.1 hypothetical protein CALK_0790 [Chitinivibrio alkaliphilus ACht1]